jgi:hypothetical protein
LELNPEASIPARSAGSMRNAPDRPFPAACSVRNSRMGGPGANDEARQSSAPFFLACSAEHFRSILNAE